MASRKIPVNVTYGKPGTQPPVYLAGSFSDPTWTAQEMDYKRDSSGVYTFSKEFFEIPGSQVQYKIRIGSDWWVLNETARTVDDGSGNLNNVVIVPSLKEAAISETPEGPATANTERLAPATPSERADHQNGPRSIVTNAAKELLARNEFRSGASTPAIARTAAEVADSAALLDKEESEPEMSDEEAGKLGVRRLTHAPIPEVAETVSQVADTAKDLDAEDLIELEPPLRNEREGDHLGVSLGIASNNHDQGEHKPPLFSHECLGMGEAGGHGEGNDIEEEYDPQAYPSPRRDQDDYNDPTLEQFPSRFGEIIDTVRRLETGLNEDQAAFEGVPPSPVIGLSRSPTDSVDYFGTSPISPALILPRPVQRLGVPAKSPHGSVSSASLQSISEAEDEDYYSPVILVRTLTDEHRHTPKSPRSEEDEGVVLDKSSRTLSQLEQADCLDPEAAAASGTNQDGRTCENAGIPQGTRMIVPENGKTHSPQIVVQSAEENETVSTSSQQAVHTTSTDAQSQPEGASNMRKRGQARDEPERTSGPAPSSAQRHENEGWLSAFFRLLFVNWIGGWVSRLCGSRRKTLLTAGTAVAFVGIAGWKYVAKDRW